MVGRSATMCGGSGGGGGGGVFHGSREGVVFLTHARNTQQEGMAENTLIYV